MASSRVVRQECPPICRCGVGEMKLFTSHTQRNPNRKFWKCPNWNNEEDCRAFRWKDGGINFQSCASHSSTVDSENSPEERKVAIVGTEKVENALRVSIEGDKIRNMFLRKIFHAIVLMCCITVVILVVILTHT